MRKPHTHARRLVAGLSLLAATGAGQAAADFERLAAQLATHPEIVALRQQSQALHEEAQAASAWPDPEVSLGIANVPIRDLAFDRFLPSAKTIGIRQVIPNGAQRQARVAQEERRAEAFGHAATQRLAQLRGELVVTLLEIDRVAAQTALARERDGLFSELLAVTRSEIEAGRPLTFRLAAIDVDRADVAREIAELEREGRVLRAQLLELVGDDGAPQAPSVAPRVWSGDASAFHAVQVASSYTRLADASRDEVRADYGPDWGLNFTYQQREAGTTPGSEFPGDDWMTASLTFSVPLWARASQAPRLRAAESRRDAALSNYRAAARKAEAHWATLSAARRAAERGIAILEGKILDLEKQIAAARVNYEAGTGDYSPVLDAQIAHLTLRGALVAERARRDGAVARANAMLVTP
jgi:cobalt-zinc-cadmium efflux system outer membrane protein